MKKLVFLIPLLAFLFISCGSPKPYYKTKDGKKKQKYYNDIQFGGKTAAERQEMPAPTKKKRKR